MPAATRRAWIALPFDRLLRHRKVLDSLLAFRGRTLTIRELSKESGVPYATTWRLVEDLRALGVVRMKRVGASQLVSVNPTSPLIPDLERLRSLSLSPHRAAAGRYARLVRRVKGVRKVILFGSVVRNQARSGSDVDIAVVLEPSAKGAAEEIYRLAAKVQDETGLNIVPIKMLPRELAANTGFARAVRGGEVLFERI